LCKPGGVLLDLTCVPPSSGVEVGGRLLGRLDQGRFLERAAQTELGISLLIEEGLLVEEASLRHEVRQHFDTGQELIDDIDQRRFTRMPPALRKELKRVDGPAIELGTCLLRRLRLLPDTRRAT
jgi:hypothetical protein